MVEKGEVGRLDPSQFIWVDLSAICPQPQHRCFDCVREHSRDKTLTPLSFRSADSQPRALLSGVT